MEKIKTIIRRLIAFFFNKIIYKFFWEKYDVGSDGNKLLPGITAVVSAKNEDYILPFCLESLVGFVDQVVCIDNGSDDNTLAEMHKFKEKFGDKIEVDIISMPGALLGDCRNAGLAATRYQWHLRWDADMVAKTSGKENIIELRKKALENPIPMSIQFPRTNVYGDFKHTTKYYEIVDPGEPILIRYCSKIKYVEYGKFDTVKLPLFYKFIQETKRYCFHCISLKSDDRLFYRNIYFDWRELCNKVVSEKHKEKLRDFNKFMWFWEEEFMETHDRKSLKFRLQRQMAEIHYIPFDTEKYGDYPDVLKREIESGNERFKVVYKDGKPYSRIDNYDEEMRNYQPSKEDLEWDMKKYFEKLHNKTICYDRYLNS